MVFSSTCEEIKIPSSRREPEEGTFESRLRTREPANRWPRKLQSFAGLDDWCKEQEALRILPILKFFLALTWVGLTRLCLRPLPKYCIFILLNFSGSLEIVRQIKYLRSFILGRVLTGSLKMRNAFCITQLCKIISHR